MWKALRSVGLATLTIAAALALSGGPVVAAPSGSAPRSYTCTGGDFATGNLVDIPSGNYANLVVTGACDVPDGATITAWNVFIAPGAALDAQSAPSTITVGHDVIAGPGALLGLGCQPPSYTGNSGHQCTVDPNGHSTVAINGNIIALGADTVLLNGITVDRNVTLIGGGGTIPWSIKNDMIGGNLTVGGVTADWLGVLFNHIGGNATLIKVTATDPGDPGRLVFVVRNTIGRNLICFGLVPGVSGGLFPGEVNVVGQHAIGQCATLV